MHTDTPHIQAATGCKQLIVDGKPFLVLAGELGNSALSSALYMKDVWSRLAENHLNTVLGSVTWEQVEPQEGQFDFSEVEQVIHDARAHGLRLVLLWFGSWKNGLCYVIDRDTSTIC
jgi:beta-galactosidase GanA